MIGIPWQVARRVTSRDSNRVEKIFSAKELFVVKGESRVDRSAVSRIVFLFQSRLPELRLPFPDTVAFITNLKRRGAYIMRGYSSSRDVTPNFLQAFDVDDGRAPCPLRTQTVTAPQALFLMNSPDIDRACDEMATRLRKETKGDLPSAVDLAYRLALSRLPSTAEKDSSLTYLQNDAARLKQLAWLLFNLDEFIYVR